MFEAQYLFKDAAVFGPWMSRGGDNVTITLDLIQSSGGTLTVQLVTKNAEDAGDGGTPISSPTIAKSGKGVYHADFVGNLEELVRYRFSVTGTNAYDYVLFRMLSPVWFDDVEAAGA